MEATRKQREGGAFTLVEVLIVIGILATLAVISTLAVSRGVMVAKRANCASNMRQIGIAIVSYSGDHNGRLPLTSHSTGDSRVKINGKWVNTIELSWIYALSEYLDEMDEVRVCPADERERRERILQINATSYLLNDIVFDPELCGRMSRIQDPARTMMAFISSRPVSRTWDHAHCGNWSSWAALTSDIAPDRHRTGGRAPDRTDGTANYLYADGHVANLSAGALKAMMSSGRKPWLLETP